jgi:hypothetical protein
MGAALKTEGNTVTIGGVGIEPRLSRGANPLAPDDSLLIHEIVDHLNAVTQLELRLL